MLNLTLAIFFSIGIYTVFRAFGILKIDILPAVVFNYFFCFLIGGLFLILTGSFPNLNHLFRQAWVFPAFLNGLVFFVSFWLLAETTKKTGMTVSAISSRLSLIIPVAVSVFVLKSAYFQKVNFYFLGLVLAVLAIVLTSLKTKSEKLLAINMSKTNYLWVYPIGVFFLTGIGDSFVVFINFNYAVEGFAYIFPVFLLLFSGLCGLVVLQFVNNSSKYTIRNFKGGLLLSIPGLISMVFIVRALEEYNYDGSLVYPVVNMGTILGSSLVGLVFFKEKISYYKVLGLFLGLLALVFIGLSK